MNLININENEQRFINNSHIPVFGCFMQQVPAALLALNKLINAYNFSTIIELGTHDAGLSTFFALYSALSKVPCRSDNPSEPVLYKNNTYSKSPTDFYTYDNVCRDKYATDILANMGAFVRLADILNDDVAIQDIRNNISKPGRTLVLCDNGDKIKEFHLYAPSLKSGDFIMLHDWAYDATRAEYLKNNNIWQSWESNWKDIEKCANENNIQQVYQDVFDDVVWFCGIKK